MTQQGDGPKVDRRGTFWDWPAAMVVVGAVIWVAIAASGRTPTVAVYLVMAFGAVAWLIRSGKFSPRR